MSRPKIVAEMDTKEAVLKTGIDLQVDEALALIDTWFEVIQVLIGEESELYSNISGEVITGDEFYRARGIISALRENKEFVIMR